MGGFHGFPVAALDFYDDLELDNTKSFWAANKHIYDEAVRTPMLALIAELADEFSSPGGRTTFFRPYRDVRFAKDKTPYKTHQGAFVAVGPALGFYLELSARGVRVGGGFYDADGPRLSRLREAMAEERTGEPLAAMLTAYDAEGWEIGGDTLKTAPRGYDVDHPRIGLLRRKQLFVGRPYGFDEEAIGPGLVERVRSDWRSLQPLVVWLRIHGEER